MKNIGLFGDSYISDGAIWTQLLKELNPDYNVEVYGKGGSNLFSAIHSWRTKINEKGSDYYDVAVFTFTWYWRLFSVHEFRNEQFCAFSEFRDYTQYHDDPIIVDDSTRAEFNKSILLHYKYIYDQYWELFDHELEIKYILDLTKEFPNTKFIFLPNTEVAKDLSKKHFHSGILLDFAFETLSNREPNSPGIMPLACGRPAHLSRPNHVIFGKLISDIIQNYQQYENSIYPIDYNIFDVI